MSDLDRLLVVVNQPFKALVDAALTPLAHLPPVIALLVISVPIGILASLAFRFLTNAEVLRRYGRRARAEISAMRLFGDDPVVLVHCLKKMAAVLARRVFHSLPACIVLILPVALLLIQLAAWFEYRPLEAGEDAIVRVEVEPAAWAAWQSNRPDLGTTPALRVVTSALHDELAQEVFWRISVESPTDGELHFERPDFTVPVHTAAGDRVLMRIASNTPSVIDGFSAVPEGLQAIKSVRVSYPPRSVSAMGFAAPWWVWLLAFSTISGWLHKVLTERES